VHRDGRDSQTSSESLECTVQYKGIEYVIQRRSDSEWAWTIKAPIGPERIGHVRGAREWVRTIAARAIDVWLLMNPHRRGFVQVTVP
jgi:hypothetical protein